LSAPATAVSPDEVRAAERASRRAFLLKRLHSITGVVPLGVFLVEHLWTNAKALQGAQAFTGAVEDLQSLPFLPLLEFFGIFLPLAYHAVYGVYLALKGRENTLEYTYARNWLYFLQRVSGVLAFAFIVYHLGEIRVQRLLYGMDPDAFYQTLQAHLSSTHWGVPWIAVLYLAGLAATVFHFANGLSTFAISWGLTVTLEAQKRAAIACWVLGVALFYLGASSVVFFATGSRFHLHADNGLHANGVVCPATAPAPSAK
jgi:succinate dehydrogenase/fumarate reductase cytochrome b subunit (b558 family)